MGYFDYKKPTVGSYLDRRNPPYLKNNKGMGNVRIHADTPAITFGGGGGGGDQYGGSRFSSVRDRLEEGSVVEDWIPREPIALHMMLRKIYLRDAISGTVVDIFSTLPWGKYWELIGLDDPKVLQMYNDMMEGINIWGQLPMICRELQIIGRNVSSLSFNERTGFWDSFVAIDPDQIRIQPVPISGHKPLIDVLSSPAWREFARSTDPRIVEMKQELNPSTVELLQNQSGYIPLEPLNTLWLARRVNQYDHIGTSIFTRILPAWAYEMALWNASLIGARRRNRAILLITAGIEDTWLPTDEEVSSLTNLFMQADEDPVGGVITVRNGVEVAEVRDPTNIWGISQEHEFLSTIKMRALGVSEAYLSGETNVSNMEAARTSLGKQILAFKEQMLTDVFYKQLFPAFARIHGFQRKTQAELNHRVNTNGYNRAYVSVRAAMAIPEHALLIPTLVTEDTLRPEGDVQYLEILNQIKDFGLPMPLRMVASAAGYDLDKAMAMMEEDAILRKRINQFATGETPDSGGGGGDDDLFGDSGGGGGGGEKEDKGGGGGAPKEQPASPGGSIEDMEKAGTGGEKGRLPPKWTVAGGADKALRSMYGNKRLIEALSQLDPRILAEVKIPAARAFNGWREED